MKYVIIGGVAGGATAAARIRRNDEKAEILLLEKGPHISYANCGLPYYIGDVIKNRERLFVQTPESFGRRFHVDVRVSNQVTAIHPDRKVLTVRDAEGREYEETYDRLLLSPGANPVRPNLPGIETPGIFTLRNVEDTDNIKSYLTEHKVKNVVVVGAGFIGLEMAENLHHAGVHVSIVEMANQVMSPIDYSMAALVHEQLINKGVALYLNEGVAAFERQNDDTIKVRLASGKWLSTDMVLLSIGVRPNTQLAQDAGIKVGEARGIWVNEYLQTSEQDIYAVGDAIEYPHPLTGKPWLCYLAGPANRQARIAADNMTKGNQEKYEGAIGTSIAKVFDLTVGSTGLPAKRLKQWGMEYESSVTHTASHAGYYPGAMPLTLKLTFHPKTGMLYGAQCIGHDGVDKRIDEIVLVIKHHGTVYDLMAMEQAYAPPFSQAKDPVAIAGYVAGNIINGTMPAISWRELQAERKEVTLIDVRTPEEYSFGHIQGAINIPLDDLRDRLQEVPREGKVVIYCAVGLRGYVACRLLMGNGYSNVRNLKGGYRTYSSATAPLPDPSTSAQPDSEDKSERLSENTEVGNSFQNDGLKNGDSCTGEQKVTIHVDACGLQCPGPIMQVKKAVDKLHEGQCVEVIATDPAFARDAESWCSMTGNSLEERHEEKGRYTVVIKKGGVQQATPGGKPSSCSPDILSIVPRGKTFILFSDDLDKALATFVLANGAAATGQKVTIFFTFWGLNVLKKERKPKVKKDIWGRMFGFMLPSSSKKLKLSQMNMMGAGSKMMRHLMHLKGIDSLESLRQQALDAGVEFIACQMSMDMMGIQREELIDEVTVGGVATYMGRADKANVNLFI
ncbi:MAG: FAD-dependent oxidoreductase [Prevotella sp.]|jgi:NADPH-dependent 2,4-dienoyl-CoA reductase/sulfur reductase-like enzyme/peroxiredoxin family protein/rhodanese-related sulfurtransferase/TusA-related sulfurtransferase